MSKRFAIGTFVLGAAMSAVMLSLQGRLNAQQVFRFETVTAQDEGNAPAVPPTLEQAKRAKNVLRQKWEYKFVSGVTPLEELGNEGWELVAVTRDASNERELFLKRPK